MVKKESKTARAKRLAENTATYRANKFEQGLLPQTVYVFDVDRPAIRKYADVLIAQRLEKMGKT